MMKRLFPLILSAVLLPAPASASSWTSLTAMGAPRYLADLVTLPDGRILAIGGVDKTGSPVARLEAYDTISDTWKDLAQMRIPRYRHTVTLLKDGRVLVVGGFDGV